jgi:hypothetical protein
LKNSQTPCGEISAFDDGVMWTGSDPFKRNWGQGRKKSEVGGRRSEVGVEGGRGPFKRREGRRQNEEVGRRESGKLKVEIESPGVTSSYFTLGARRTSNVQR